MCKTENSLINTYLVHDSLGTGHDLKCYILENLLSSGYLDLEIAATFQLQVQDHEPFLQKIYFPKHKEPVQQYTG